MQVASVPLGLVSTQAPLISRSTRPAKLPFFQKTAAVVVIVDFARVCKTTGNGGRGRMHETNCIRANAPSPLLSKSSVQKGGGVLSGDYGACTIGVYTAQRRSDIHEAIHVFLIANELVAFYCFDSNYWASETSSLLEYFSLC